MSLKPLPSSPYKLPHLDSQPWRFVKLFLSVLALSFYILAYKTVWQRSFDQNTLTKRYFSTPFPFLTLDLGLMFGDALLSSISRSLLTYKNVWQRSLGQNTLPKRSSPDLHVHTLQSVLPLLVVIKNRDAPGSVLILSVYQLLKCFSSYRTITPKPRSLRLHSIQPCVHSQPRMPPLYFLPLQCFYPITETRQRGVVQSVTEQNPSRIFHFLPFRSVLPRTLAC